MKSMPKFIFIALALLLVGVLAIPFAHSQSTGTEQGNQQEKRIEGRGFGRGHWGRRFGGRLLSRLNLTDAQKEQMKQIKQSFRERTSPLRQELKGKYGELRQANTGETFNEALATQKLNEISAIQVKLMGERFKLKQEISSVLTPEQKTQLEQMREQMKAKREEFKKRRAERRANSQ
jgi:Spy/CpxP family protein refolding chaperone